MQVLKHINTFSFAKGSKQYVHLHNINVMEWGQMQFSILPWALLDLISNLFIWKCIMNKNAEKRS